MFNIVMPIFVSCILVAILAVGVAFAFFRAYTLAKERETEEFEKRLFMRERHIKRVKEMERK
ncbi:hypothetical protein [Mycoplasmopsis gallinacea]|uniref:Uncharacterized protein n=1 Tax=Mycoplasmopsis gallinacea TaxID=29556 RepID=A0A6H0V2H2_9BACT|nr:hypothetical protein [Mycoplasmopsis gallinacea]QIW62531.1 hypothetical protein GOQ20_03875 [Mycoplasmopsis gallinacea]